MLCTSFPFSEIMESVVDLNIKEENSSGIRKILDCKISPDGRQMYKVEWDTTWEFAESLTSCQNLIDEFWSHVNKAKSFEHVARQQRQISSSTLLNDIGKLSADDKSHIDTLIKRTSSTSTGSSILSPSQMLVSSTNSLSLPNTMKRKLEETSNDVKCGTVKASKGGSGASDGLKYIANFTNPYVKLIVVCKVCNKEQSLKNSQNWANHFMVHDKSLGHKCPYCPKTFPRPNVLNKHIASKHSNDGCGVKEETW